MVRHGRLSTGCQTCRKRKIKCDKLRPACTQCVRSGWHCPRDADSADRMFIYCEPQRAAINTFQAVHATMSRNASSDAKHLVHTTKRRREHLVSAPKLPMEIVQPLHCRASEYYLANHVLRPTRAIRGYNEYLYTFSAEVLRDPMVATSLSAVGLAAYSYKYQYPEILSEARCEYVRSLRFINSALSSSQANAATDAIVISILLLISYESHTAETRRTMSNRYAHVKGAATLLCLRGDASISSCPRRQLFHHLFSCISVHCIMLSLPIPGDLVLLHEKALRYVDTTSDPAWRLSELIIKVIEFRDELRSGRIRDPDTIIVAAQKLDSELASVADTFPSSWQFEIFTSQERSELVFGEGFHVYPDLWIAYNWNNLRACRMILLDEIRWQLEQRTILAHPCMMAGLLQHQRTLVKLHQLSSEICATVPQHCGYHLELLNCTGPNEPSSPHKQLRDSDTSIPRDAGAHLLFWPFINAGQFTPSQHQRNWIAGRIPSVGQQGALIADILKLGQRVF
ncbi:hypothetical protein BO86DRAFT_249948 [Aspergillus japonicus CBS 114.51]|uniref:Zn(2)-C6 fungal-type domain-containing protein n=1 Tax=Aspergillus japonicus CBS 114.51 TaxID=1448312 RepID=A0A8T8WM70_ASPJA|nr:hypothetical protein BO86DRAFT_249948 [Aspergillus japonicus CBS 114.51]RAH76499.1 hypothetical protein BO86DRAFT_249948 [Aspergillus japonicus CBS 114.51]